MRSVVVEGKGGLGGVGRHPGLDPGSTFLTHLFEEKVDAGSSPA